MKNINVMFEDAEYKAVKKKKGLLTWKEYIMKEVEEEQCIRKHI